MTRIFISYRRADSRKDAGRIYDRLVEAFGKENVFKDVDDIPAGSDFRGVLREAVARCDVQLAIIGNQWLGIKGEDGKRRLDNPGDFVRIEIETALQRDNCRLIPVLVDGAPMPNADDLPPDLRELAFKHAATVRDDPDFHPDVTRLIRELGGQPATKLKPVPATFDVYTEIDSFYRAFDAQDWDHSRELLAAIRASEQAPRIFDVDAHEQEVWNAIEAQERDKQYDLLRLMAQRSNADRVREALQVFWQDFPDYDPDNIAASIRPEASAEAVRAIIGDPFEWCEVPAGEFIYGNDNDDHAAPRQVITLPAFAIAKYPITYRQFQSFIDADDGFTDDRWWNGLAAEGKHRRQPGDQVWRIDDHPREHVSWYDAMAFCRWLSFKLDGGYDIDRIDAWFVRLPTEYEWEKAARGTDGRLYPYGNEYDRTRGNTGESEDAQTTPVTQYPQGASPYGAYDMSGNVWELCLTDYDDPAPEAAKENITSNTRRALRGGSWFFDVNFARAVVRDYGDPYDRLISYGFRVCRPFAP